MIRQNGDDLDDDFVPDDLVALSDDGASEPTEDVQDLLSADEDDAEATSKAKEDVQEKKRKRREKEKERKAKVTHSTAPCTPAAVC